MTEKDYAGTTSYGAKNASKDNSKSQMKNNSFTKNTSKQITESDSEITNKEIENLTKAGKIAVETISYAKSFIKHGMLLIEIAEKIEEKIIQLKGKPAFPVNLSINEVAAHSTPLPDSKDTAHGLLKVDLGVHIDGYVADTAFSLDLENSEENRKLIKVAESALHSACKIINSKIKIREIGAVIEKEIKSHNLQPIQNLSGHSIEQYELHAGISVPNYDNAQERILGEGIFAIEPFSTNGLGKVRDGKPSSIYSLTKDGNVRDSFSREVLHYIQENYSTLPFCTRWLHKKFGSRIIIALRNIEQAGLLHHYPQLIEAGNGKVAQAENTIIVLKDQVIITTSQK